LVVKKDQPALKLRQEFFKIFLSLKNVYSLETRGNRFIFYQYNRVIPVWHMEKFYSDFWIMSKVLRECFIMNEK
jgi:hypothetical protein